MFQIHVHGQVGIRIQGMYTCRYTNDKGQKDRTVCRYLALPYGFSLSEWVVQVVLPNEVHVLCLLVGCCTAFFTIGSHRHVCDVESWDGRIKNDEEMGKREGML